MGFPLENWDAAFADIGMFIGADGGCRLVDRDCCSHDDWYNCRWQQ